MITVFERSYKIDKDALQEYGRTTQAGGVSPIIQGNENKLTNGAVLAKFLETVDGDGVCRVEYRHSKKYDEVVLDESGLIHSRVYPVEHYTCAFACLPLNLRVLALHSVITTRSICRNASISLRSD